MGDYNAANKLRSFAVNDIESGACKWVWLWQYFNSLKAPNNNYYEVQSLANHDTSYALSQTNKPYMLLFNAYNFFSGSSWKKDVEKAAAHPTEYAFGTNNYPNLNNYLPYNIVDVKNSETK